MTDYERLDYALASRGRRTRVDVYSSGSRLTDFGPQQAHPLRTLFPVRFTFNTAGQLTRVTPRLRGWWLLIGTGVRRRAHE